ARQQPLRLQLRMGADQEVGHDALSAATSRCGLAAVPPELAGKRRGRGHDGIEHDAERPQGLRAGLIVGEQGANLRPYARAGDQRALIVRLAQSLPGRRAEGGIAEEDVEEYGRVDRGLHRRRRERRPPGRGPRIWSRSARVSTARRGLMMPKTLSTAWSP